MSFVFGDSDSIKVIELAKKTCDACKAAPADFAEAAQSLDNLTITLNSVNSEYEKPDSLLRRDERNAFEVAKLGNGCLTTLQRLDSIITKYKSFGEDRPKALDRFRFPRKEVLEIKGRLALYCTNYSVLLQTVGVSSLGRIERYTIGTDRELARILEAVDRLGAEIRTGGRLSSVLSDHSNDEKKVWKDFRTRLIK